MKKYDSPVIVLAIVNAHDIMNTSGYGGEFDWEEAETELMVVGE